MSDAIDLISVEDPFFVKMATDQAALQILRERLTMHGLVVESTSTHDMLTLLCDLALDMHRDRDKKEGHDA